MPNPTREERAKLDQQRRQLDGHAEAIRSHVVTDAYREGFNRIRWRGDRKRPAKETTCPTS